MENNVQQRYREAVERVTENLKKDKGVLAVFLAGSLAYDKVWEKSDVDMLVIVRDDQKPDNPSYCIDEDDIVVNLDMVTRTAFTKRINKAVGGLGTHSLYSRGQFLYTQDESLKDYLEDMGKIGKADRDYAVFVTAVDLMYFLEKVEKWVRVKNDATYARQYLISMAGVIARMELCTNYISPSREAVLQAAEINPALMEQFYYYPMNNIMDSEAVMELLKKAYDYLDKHLDIITKPVITYLCDDEPKTVTAMSKHFKVGGHGLTHLTEYLKNKGIIGKASVAIRVTAKGRHVVDEIAYTYVTAD